MTDQPTEPEVEQTPPEPDQDQVRMNPWLIAAGIVALLIGLFSGLIMSQATLVK